MNALMRRLPPGGFPWLVLHELRLSIRARRRGGRSTTVALILLAIYIGLGTIMALGLRHVPIAPGPIRLEAALAASIVIASFMTTQAMLGSQRTLYENGDLDLLLSAPIPPRTVLLAKLAGIAASVVVSFAILVLPLTLPIAILGHPGLLGIPLLVVSLALGCACLGLGLTLAVSRIAGPRAARTVGQILAGLLAGAIFITSQLISNSPGRRGGGMTLFRWFRDHHVGDGGLGALPGRAAFGDPTALALFLGVGILVFSATGWLFDRNFLRSYQQAGMHVGSRPKASTSRRAIGRHFRAGLFASMFAKEWRLLARDPALTFQIVLRVIYMLPLLLPVFGMGRGGGIFAPTLAFASVFIAGQVVGSLAWLTMSGEDAPDLLAVAPVSKSQVERVKLATSLVIAAPLALVPSLAIATVAPVGALISLVFTAAGGAVAGLIEMKWQKPMPRKAFGRRRQGSVVASLLTVLSSAAVGGASAGLVWLVA